MCEWKTIFMKITKKTITQENCEFSSQAQLKCYKNVYDCHDPHVNIYSAIYPSVHIPMREHFWGVLYTALNATVADFKPISLAMCTFHKFPTKDRKGETVYMKIVLAYQKSQLLCLMFALALSIYIYSHYTRTQFSCNLASATMPIVNSIHTRSYSETHFHSYPLPVLRRQNVNTGRVSVYIYKTQPYVMAQPDSYTLSLPIPYTFMGIV